MKQYSNYVPVDVNRNSCAIYSDSKVFTRDRLLDAYNLLTGENMALNAVMRDGNVTFSDNDSITWSIPEVYLAYQSLTVAEENNFSFYAVKDTKGIPQLFVSRPFKSHRILVNALTTESILLSKKQHVNKVASMIDHSYTYAYCQELFQVYSAIENGSGKYLDCVIMDSGTEDEMLVLNPITIPHGDIIQYIGIDVLEELTELVCYKTNETESFVREQSGIRRKDISYWPMLSMDYCKSILDMHQKAKEKKSNYVAIVDANYNHALYFSTNNRYLVNARTLECATVTNSNIKSTIKEMLAEESTNTSEISLLWQLAIKEK